MGCERVKLEVELGVGRSLKVMAGNDKVRVGEIGEKTWMGKTVVASLENVQMRGVAHTVLGFHCIKCQDLK